MGATLAHAGSVSTAQCYDTFINSLFPGNNNGGSTTFFTGEGGDGAHMRALIRCDLPAAVNTRTTVTQATLTVKTAGLGATGTANPTAATEILQVLTQPWGEGNKAGTTTMTYTVGQACTTGEASWNQNQCSITNWTSAGGAVGTTSATAASPALIGANVAFSSAAMASDIQNWIAGNNYGWRMSSSTDGFAGQAQRFNSKESGAGPSLAINFSCKPGFLDTGDSCSACTSAAQAACVTSVAGNTCVDPGPPSGYYCDCGNAAYSGTGTATCTFSSSTALTSQCMLTFVEGQPFTMTASVQGSNPTGHVDFSDGSDTICSGVALSAGAADCTTSALSVPSGTLHVYELTANYAGDADNTPSMSSALAVTVLSAADVLFRNGFDAESPSCPVE